MMPPPHEAIERLEELLLRLDHPDVLRRLLKRIGVELVHDLPGPEASFRKLCFEAAHLLYRHGCVNPRLFFELRKQLNAYSSDIDHLARLFGVVPTQGMAPASPPLWQQDHTKAAIAPGTNPVYLGDSGSLWTPTTDEVGKLLTATTPIPRWFILLFGGLTLPTVVAGGALGAWLATRRGAPPLIALPPERLPSSREEEEDPGDNVPPPSTTSKDPPPSSLAPAPASRRHTQTRRHRGAPPESGASAPVWGDEMVTAALTPPYDGEPGKEELRLEHDKLRRAEAGSVVHLEATMSQVAPAYNQGLLFIRQRAAGTYKQIPLELNGLSWAVDVSIPEQWGLGFDYYLMVLPSESGLAPLHYGTGASPVQVRPTSGPEAAP